MTSLNDKIKTIAQSAAYFKDAEKGMLRIDSYEDCDEDCFYCYDDDDYIYTIKYSEIDLSVDKFYKLTEINPDDF